MVQVRRQKIPLVRPFCTQYAGGNALCFSFPFFSLFKFFLSFLPETYSSSKNKFFRGKKKERLIYFPDKPVRRILSLLIVPKIINLYNSGTLIDLEIKNHETNQYQIKKKNFSFLCNPDGFYEGENKILICK